MDVDSLLQLDEESRVESSSDESHADDSAINFDSNQRLTPEARYVYALTHRLILVLRGKLRQSFRMALRKAVLVHHAAMDRETRGSLSETKFKFHISPSKRTFPLVVLVNPKSGGNQVSYLFFGLASG